MPEIGAICGPVHWRSFRRNMLHQHCSFDSIDIICFLGGIHKEPIECNRSNGQGRRPQAYLEAIQGDICLTIATESKGGSSTDYGRHIFRASLTRLEG
jgi:hypothetical protein